MNADDIADMVEKEPYHTNLNRSTIAYFIRQQQAEIEALKAEKDRITRDLIGASFYEHDYKTLMAKPPLTDEEIKQIFLEQTGFYFDDNPADDLALMDFARAILRKAQEK